MKAQEKLKIALGKCANGTLEEPHVKRIAIDELAEDFFRDYRINGKRSIVTTEARWRLHLKPFFGGMKAVNVTSEQLARYVDERQQQGATNATINRELSALKRIFSLGFKVRSQKSHPDSAISPPGRE